MQLSEVLEDKFVVYDGNKLTTSSYMYTTYDMETM